MQWKTNIKARIREYFRFTWTIKYERNSTNSVDILWNKVESYVHLVIDHVVCMKQNNKEEFLVFTRVADSKIGNLFLKNLWQSLSKNISIINFKLKKIYVTLVFSIINCCYKSSIIKYMYSTGLKLNIFMNIIYEFLFTRSNYQILPLCLCSEAVCI